MTDMDNKPLPALDAYRHVTAYTLSICEASGVVPAAVHVWVTTNGYLGRGDNATPVPLYAEVSIQLYGDTLDRHQRITEDQDAAAILFRALAGHARPGEGNGKTWTVETDRDDWQTWPVVAGAPVRVTVFTSDHPGADRG